VVVTSAGSPWCGALDEQIRLGRLVINVVYSSGR
jgi:hypothetical protein